MSDRRRFTSDDLEALGRVISAEVRHELEDRSSLKKNGHTWRQWLGKVFTPDRVVLGSLALISLIYTFGGDIREAREQLRVSAQKADVASTKADVAATKSEAAATKAEAAALTQSQLQEQVTALQQQIAESRRAQEAFRTDVRSKLSVSVTRSEFNDAINQQIVPRLERIEKAQPK